MVASRWPQGGSKMAPRLPNMPPRWPQDGPRMAPEAARCPPDGHKMAPISPKRPQEAPRYPQDGAKMAQAPRCPNMALMWPLRWPQDGPKMAPRFTHQSSNTQSKIRLFVVPVHLDFKMANRPQDGTRWAQKGPSWSQTPREGRLGREYFFQDV